MDGLFQQPVKDCLVRKATGVGARNGRSIRALRHREVPCRFATRWRSSHGLAACAASTCRDASAISRPPWTGATKSSTSCCPIGSATVAKPIGRASIAATCAPRDRPRFALIAWAQSGGERWQGGTLRGIRSKLDYLDNLGVTTLWIGPVFKQRAHLDTYHGYAIQDFLEVDPRFGSRADLIALVDAAHARGMRIVLDVIFNHSGCNWLYANGEREPAFRHFPAFYQKGDWFDGQGGRVQSIAPNATRDGCLANRAPAR